MQRRIASLVAKSAGRVAAATQTLTRVQVARYGARSKGRHLAASASRQFSSVSAAIQPVSAVGGSCGMRWATTEAAVGEDTVVASEGVQTGAGDALAASHPRLVSFLQANPPQTNVEGAMARVLPATRDVGTYAASADINRFHEHVMFAEGLWMIGDRVDASDDTEESVRFGVLVDPNNPYERTVPVFTSRARLDAYLAEAGAAGDAHADLAATVSGDDQLISMSMREYLSLVDEQLQKEHGLHVRKTRLRKQKKRRAKGVHAKAERTPSPSVVINPLTPYEYEFPAFVLSYFGGILRRLSYSGVI